MSSNMYGANPEQLRQLGTTLKRQIDAINALTSTVTSACGNTTWHGPAKERFMQEWNGSFKNALAKLGQAFDAAGQDCVLRSQELVKVMGR
jgi:uncharacterized protein YukE